MAGYQQKSAKDSQRVTEDTFGRATVLRAANEVWSKKKEEFVSGIYKTVVHLGGKDYIIEVNTNATEAETKHGARNRVWVKVTKQESNRKKASI